MNHSPNGRQPQSLTSASMLSSNQQQLGGSSTSSGHHSATPPSGLLIGSSRRESREAETQFMSIDTTSQAGHPSNGPGPVNELLQHPHANSLEHGLANYSVGSERQLNLAIGAVLLDEWLRELSAVTQEQCIMMLSEQVQQPTRTA
uniref:Uncharacterized protein n=1 Tax=Anopheles culicifacies TaxID=139723 RepID=A0A182MFE5_9DIPT